MNEKIPYGRHEILDEDVAAVIAALRSGWLTQGPRVAELEAALCAATGARYAVAVTNGTAALHLANLALGVGPGDLGITSAITFVASANALRYVGAQSAFCDVDPSTGLLDPQDLERRVEAHARAGRRLRVIVPVDFAGQPADLPRVRAIADRSAAFVVEDAAHALGARYEASGSWHGAGSCAHSDAAILSFHPVKHVTTGEGGAVLTGDAALYRRLCELRTHGIHKDSARFSRPPSDPMVGPWYYEQESLGHNLRMSDLQCALGISQLARLPRFLDRRRELAARYRDALALEPLAGVLRPLAVHAGRDSAYHLFVVQVVRREGESVGQLAARRRELFLFLQSQGIEPQVHYIPVPWQPYHREEHAESEYPGATAYYAASLSLPLFPALSDEAHARVLAALREWASK